MTTTTKKVLCIKDTIGFKKGKEYITSGTNDSLIKSDFWFYSLWKEYTEYFQEVVEEEVRKPKFKIWDKVVMDNYYIIVTEIENGKDYLYNWWSEKSIRLATPEEIELYYN